MATHTVTLEVDVTIETTDAGEAGIERFVGLETGNELRASPGMSKDAVLDILARSCVYGYTDANQDGWADLDPEDIQARVSDVRGWA